MILDTQIEARSIETKIAPKENREFNWRECWYPVCFVQDLPKNRHYNFSIYDEPFIVFRNQNGQLVCLTDRCPHRAAKLSDGQIIDGKIECLYHGWQFGSEGECLHIPQLPTDAKMPHNACVKSFKVIELQGMIWMWAGAAELADSNRIPTIPKLDEPGFVYSDKITELPCDIGYVIEHMLDPAHIHITHHGYQGNRKKAQPLEMEVIESSIEGFRGRFRDTKLPNQTWRYLDFIAPSLAHLHFPISDRGWFFGQAFYFFPLSKGKCRILTRSYRNFVTWQVKLTPRWWIHLKQNNIVAQDVSILLGQEAEVERLGQNIKEIYTPIPTCDTFAIEYRKWLDRYGASLPFYRGYSTSKGGKNTDESRDVQIKPYFRHTEFCNSCQGAYRATKQVKQACVGIAIALLALAILTDPFWLEIAAVSGAMVAVITAVLADRIKTKFEDYL